MKITSDTIKQFDDSIFHDTAISIIICDYEHHLIKMPLLGHLKNDKSPNMYLLFKETKSFSMNFEEIWGEGIYINEIVILENSLDSSSNTNSIKVSITLNSGDIINICCKTMEFKKETL
jgi:hypothetical protein